MLELIFIDRETGHVNYAITNVINIRHVTSAKVSFETEGCANHVSWLQTEKLVIERIER